MPGPLLMVTITFWIVPVGPFNIGQISVGVFNPFVVVVVDPDAMVQLSSLYPNAYSPTDVSTYVEQVDPPLTVFPAVTRDIIGFGSVKHADAYGRFVAVPLPYWPFPLWPAAYTVFVAPW